MFRIPGKLVKVRSVTNVPEFKGEKREHGCSVKFEWQTDNTILDELEPGLRQAFYIKASGKPKANDDGQQEMSLPREDVDLNERRFESVQMPLKLKKEYADHELTYMCGASEQSKIKLTEVKLSDFSVDLQQGGSVLVMFSAYSKPGAEVQGRIDHMAQTEVEILLHPATKKQQDLIAEEQARAPKKTRKDKASQDPFANSDLAQDDTRIDGNEAPESDDENTEAEEAAE